MFKLTYAFLDYLDSYNLTVEQEVEYSNKFYALALDHEAKLNQGYGSWQSYITLF